MHRLTCSECYADITPKERAIANSQRSFVSFLFLQLSNSFLRILAVPNKAVFSNSPVLMVTCSFSSHASNLLLTSPSAPTTTCTTSRCLIPYSLSHRLVYKKEGEKIGVWKGRWKDWVCEKEGEKLSVWKGRCKDWVYSKEGEKIGCVKRKVKRLVYETEGEKIECMKRKVKRLIVWKGRWKDWVHEKEGEKIEKHKLFIIIIIIIIIIIVSLLSFK